MTNVIGASWIRYGSNLRRHRAWKSSLLFGRPISSHTELFPTFNYARTFGERVQCFEILVFLVSEREAKSKGVTTKGTESTQYSRFDRYTTGNCRSVRCCSLDHTRKLLTCNRSTRRRSRIRHRRCRRCRWALQKEKSKPRQKVGWGERDNEKRAITHEAVRKKVERLEQKTYAGDSHFICSDGALWTMNHKSRERVTPVVTGHSRGAGRGKREGEANARAPDKREIFGGERPKQR